MALKKGGPLARFFIACSGFLMAGSRTAVARAGMVGERVDGGIRSERTNRRFDLAVARGDGESKATSVARKLAADKGVDLAHLAGTGSSGRITKSDVLAAAAPQAGPDESALADEEGPDLSRPLSPTAISALSSAPTRPGTSRP